MLAKKA
jgi:hypothetical protein